MASESWIVGIFGCRRMPGLKARRSAIGMLVAASLMAGATGPVSGQDAGDAPVAEASGHAAPEIHYGAGEFIRPDDDQTPNANERLPDGGFSVTYRDAEIAYVVNEVLGEFLGVDYTIANDVRGQLTLRMEDIQTRGEAIQNLRDALAAVGVSLVDRGDFVAIVRGNSQDGGRSVAVLRPGEPAPPGTGVVILTLDHAAPSDIASVVGALASGVRVALSDDARRAMVLTGEAQALTAASEAVALLDVDWFAQVSSGIFEIEFATADEMAGELRPLLGPYEASIVLIPIQRLNTLVVMASSRAALRQAEAWIARLDQPRASAGTSGQLVYTVQNADPEDLLDALYQLLGMGQYRAGSGLSGLPDLTGGGGDYASMASTQRRPSLPAPPQGVRRNDSDLQIGAAPNQNLIMVRGTPERVAEAEELLHLLDQPRAQVLIEAAIIEVTLTDETRFGVNWAALEGEHLGITLADNSKGQVSSLFPGVSVTYLNADIEAVLNMLSSETEVEVISRPSILVLHNEQAELQVGDQVPVVVQSAVSISDPGAPIVNQTAYRNTGVILTVTPQIRAGGMVEVEVLQEVSGVAQTTSSGIDSPTITQRRIATTLLVPSGQSVAMGGLISTRRTSGESGLPGLRHAPLIGRLFRSQSVSEDRIELLVILTTRIISDPNELGDAMLELPSALARLRARIVEP
jgi:general secretion pathway protein D